MNRQEWTDVFFKGFRVFLYVVVLGVAAGLLILVGGNPNYRRASAADVNRIEARVLELEDRVTRLERRGGR